MQAQACPSSTTGVVDTLVARYECHGAQTVCNLPHRPSRCDESAVGGRDYAGTALRRSTRSRLSLFALDPLAAAAAAQALDSPFHKRMQQGGSRSENTMQELCAAARVAAEVAATRSLSASAETQVTRTHKGCVCNRWRGTRTRLAKQVAPPRTFPRAIRSAIRVRHCSCQPRGPARRTPSRSGSAARQRCGRTVSSEERH